MKQTYNFSHLDIVHSRKANGFGKNKNTFIILKTNTNAGANMSDRKNRIDVVEIDSKFDGWRILLLKI